LKVDVAPLVDRDLAVLDLPLEGIRLVLGVEARLSAVGVRVLLVLGGSRARAGALAILLAVLLIV
jgi:hypothetical protein